MTEFISRNYGNEGYEIISKTDSHEHYRATEEFARRLIDHTKPATNADRIRAMSDEELKEFICSNSQCKFCKFERWGRCELLDWLQQPAVEGE